MNNYNEEAPEGYEWVLVKTNAKMIEAETDDYSFWISSIFFEFISESGDIYGGDVLGMPEPEFASELYNGGSSEGYTAGLVKIGENATLRYGLSNYNQVFFNLQ